MIASPEKPSFQGENDQIEKRTTSMTMMNTDHFPEFVVGNNTSFIIFAPLKHTFAKDYPTRTSDINTLYPHLSGLPKKLALPGSFHYCFYVERTIEK